MLALCFAATVVLVALVAVVRLLEPRFAFFPTAGESLTPNDLGVEFEALTLSTRDSERLHAWSIGGQETRARILYFHGNGGNLSVWAPIVTGIAARRFAVFAFDYRGYGLSTGRPTEQGLYRDVDAAVDHFWRVSSNAPVVYWGRSLGVAMAAYGATRRKPDGLILESGFPDARQLIRGSPLLSALAVFATYRFPSNTFLERLDTSVPVLVMHGDDDQIVPIAQGRALFEGITARKQFITIRGGDHNDLSPADPDRYWDAVEGFVESLRWREL